MLRDDKFTGGGDIQMLRDDKFTGGGHTDAA